ncbi:MAG: hypothetical protein ACRD6X_19830, partial [Pyrinomonadaceae bacterium]
MKNIFLIAIFVLSFTAYDALAATYTVTNTNDDGPGSLRQAVATADSTPEADVIVFNIAGCPNGVCTITLTSDGINVNTGGNGGRLSILNPAGPQSLIISGNNTVTFGNTGTIFYGGGGELTLEGLTLERAASAAINLIGAQVNISNSILRNNLLAISSEEFGIV